MILVVVNENQTRGQQKIKRSTKTQIPNKKPDVVTENVRNRNDGQEFEEITIVCLLKTIGQKKNQWLP